MEDERLVELANQAAAKIRAGFPFHDAVRYVLTANGVNNDWDEWFSRIGKELSGRRSRRRRLAKNPAKHEISSNNKRLPF